MVMVPGNWIGYLIFTLTVLSCLLVGTVCGVSAVRQIKRQVKLYHSIRLVELRSAKLHYLLFMLLDLFLLVIASLALFGVFRPGFRPESAASPSEILTALSLGATVYLLTGLGFLLTVLFLAKSAVVDKGIYTASYYLDWYHVYDYIIDESTGRVTLSANRETFGTIRGTTAPLKVPKNDISKLKFILNKNKNKFSV